jgi:hypothetical protein
MTCTCSSCVRLGYAQKPHWGDCDACGADGDTATVNLDLYGYMPAQPFEVCSDCVRDLENAEASIMERANEVAADDGRCWRNYAE